MKRFPWKTNHSEEQPCRMVCYDCETWQEEVRSEPGRVAHSFRLACGWYFTRKGDRWTLRSNERFTDRYRLLDWIISWTRQREPLWVYAHNASFDATVMGLWEALDSGTLRMDTPGRRYLNKTTNEWRQAADRHGQLAVDNLPFIVETWCDRGMIKWVDSLNYIRVALAKLGQWVGIPKWDLPSESASDDDWFNYCDNDVRILSTAVLRLMDLWKGRKLGNWQATMAGLSYSCFRHLSPNNGIVAHGDDENEPDDIAPYWIAREPIPLSAYDVSRLERRAYYGARTLVNYVGDIGPRSVFPGRTSLYESREDRPRINGPVTVFDVNGLYAYCMSTFKYPIELIEAIENPTIDELFNNVRELPCIADVSLDSPDCAYPYREDRRTIYVRGRFATTLCGPELLRACEYGHVRYCHTLAVYHSGRPFKPFVDYWWKIRQDALSSSDDCTAKLAKGIINALYGKLGQRKPMWQRSNGVTVSQRWGPFIYDRGDGRKFLRFRAIAGNIQELVGRRDCQHTFTAAAAYVTAYGRYVMEGIRLALPDRSVIYQDTDSLFCLAAASSALRAMGMVDPLAMGKMKEEGTYESVSIYGPKNYDREGSPTVAGLRSIREELGHRRWVQWHFERCNSIVGRQPDGTVHMWQQLFAAPGSTPGYSVHGDGWTVPIRRG